jgi:hypothetical protein
MRHLLTVVGIVAALILLLVVAVRPALADSPAVERADQPQDISWIFLALVGGVALLAGVVWVRKLRRMMP